MIAFHLDGVVASLVAANAGYQAVEVIDLDIVLKGSEAFGLEKFDELLRSFCKNNQNTLPCYGRSMIEASDSKGEPWLIVSLRLLDDGLNSAEGVGIDLDGAYRVVEQDRREVERDLREAQLVTQIRTLFD